MNNIWQLQDAKSKFSEMVERTLVNGAQIVTRRAAPEHLLGDVIAGAQPRGDTAAIRLHRGPTAAARLQERL